MISYNVFVLFITIVLFLLILNIFYVKLTKGQCDSKRLLHGKTAIITGATSGIGKETALDLAARGARVILACRNIKLAERVKNEIISKTGNNNIVVHYIEFESLKSVRKFSQIIHATEQYVHILINNAGAGGLGNSLTEDGLQITMQVNHFGPFLLTNLLLDLLKHSAPSRIVTVSSVLHLTAILDPNDLNKAKTILTSDMINYSNSKLCNILMSNELARKLSDTKVTSNCLHPGGVRTPIFKNLPWWLRWPNYLWGLLYFKNCKEGAQTSIHLAVCEKVEGVTGEYYADCHPCYRSRQAKDKYLAKQVWEQSVKFVNLQNHEIHYN